MRVVRRTLKCTAHLLLDTLLESLELLKHLAPRQLGGRLLPTNGIQLSTQSVSPFVVGTTLSNIELVPDCVLHVQKIQGRNEASRS